MSDSRKLLDLKTVPQFLSRPRGRTIQTEEVLLTEAANSPGQGRYCTMCAEITYHAHMRYV